ncbi:hypothetical protein [Streptomyces sp. AD55]|uniref:hypothetical protein n=1 Tax=Streptomyces sp. AD55 TaxID=3242895 RepID=UPI003527EE32
MRLSRPVHRATLAVHVVASAAWIGITLGLLSLALAATSAPSAASAEPSLRAMRLFADLLPRWRSPPSPPAWYWRSARPGGRPATGGCGPRSG